MQARSLKSQAKPCETWKGVSAGNVVGGKKSKPILGPVSGTLLAVAGPATTNTAATTARAAASHFMRCIVSSLRLPIELAAELPPVDEARDRLGDVLGLRDLDG